MPIQPPGTEDDEAPPILVNIADLLAYWTGGLLKSTVHRVIFPKEEEKGGERNGVKSGGEDRYSIAYFLHPMDEVRLEAVPSEVVRNRNRETVKGQGVGYGAGSRKSGDEEVLTAEEHLRRRLDETYGWKKGAADTDPVPAAS